jgi:hypothetical protein
MELVRFRELILAHSAIYTVDLKSSFSHIPLELFFFPFLSIMSHLVTFS